MTSRLCRAGGLALAAALLPTVAFAHTGVGATHGVAHGFMHPITGLDHLLAMVAVGILAWQIGGRALWLVPATFATVMAAGGALGVAGVAMPAVEVAIALSVVVLGVAVAAGYRLPVAVATVLVGVFAVFHGHAHGTEMPAGAAGLAYGAGFMAGTALLHLAGLGLGYAVGLAGTRLGPVVTRAAGGVIALIGAGILAGAV